MPCIKRKKFIDNTIVKEKDNRTLEEIVREVPLNQFLECKETREILVDESYYKFEAKTKQKLAKIYHNYNTVFGNNIIFSKDWKNEYGDLLADIVYDHTMDNFDYSIFYVCPGLAAPLFK